jgi:hypothetical protein
VTTRDWHALLPRWPGLAEAMVRFVCRDEDDFEEWRAGGFRIRRSGERWLAEHPALQGDDYECQTYYEASPAEAVHALWMVLDAWYGDIDVAADLSMLLRTPPPEADGVIVLYLTPDDSYLPLETPPFHSALEADAWLREHGHPETYWIVGDLGRVTVDKAVEPAGTTRPRSPGATEEPAPTTGAGRPIWELVVEDMQARDAMGRQRYGTPLLAGNGRDALVDAYQEALDLAVYLRQAIEEREVSDAE